MPRLAQADEGCVRGGAAYPRIWGSHILAVPCPCAHPAELPPCARALPHIPMGQPQPPKVPRGSRAQLVSPTWGKLSSWGQMAALGGHPPLLPVGLGSGLSASSPPVMPSMLLLPTTALPPKQGAFQGTPAWAGPTGEAGANPLSVATSSAHAILSRQGSPSCTPLPLRLLFLFCLWETSILDPPEEALSPGANRPPQHTNSLLQATLFRLNTLHCP